MFLFVAGAVAFREQTPRRSKLLPTATGLGFACATTVRMVHRIARNATVNGADAPMAGAACLAENHILVLGITNLTDSGVAVLVNPANFARRKADLSIAFVARHERGSAAGGSDHLAPASRR